MIARIQIDAYRIRDAMKESPDKFQRLKDLIPGVPDKAEELFSYIEAIVDLTAVLPELAALGIEPTIKAFKNNMVIGVHEKIKYLEDQQNLLRQQIYQDGMLVQVHIPNVGMYLIDEVDVLSNVCTQTLQDYLDEGWRILCVCPPNGQRRPDYILGRCRKRTKE